MRNNDPHDFQHLSSTSPHATRQKTRELALREAANSFASESQENPVSDLHYVRAQMKNEIRNVR